MQRICLFKNKHDKNIIDHRNYNFFAQSIVIDTLELLDCNKILQRTDLWDLIDFFQLKNIDHSQWLFSSLSVIILGVDNRIKP